MIPGIHPGKASPQNFHPQGPLQLNLFRTCTLKELLHPLETIPINMCNFKLLTLALL